MECRRVAVVVALGVLALVAASCDEHLPARLDRPGAAPPDAGGVDADPPVDAGADAPVDAADDVLVVPLDGGPCNVRVDAPPITGANHVAVGTPIVYASNPPSSGEHYGAWANFQEYSREIDDGYLVHSMEHGAVVLFYECDDDASAACADMVTQLRAVRAAVPTDPSCSEAIRVRVIIAPRSSNDVPVAAAAWGHTYRADCVDPLTLGAFIQAHYAKAPEDFCFAGSVF
ncbi:MAG: DUF3105 domain-containing protein [Labilithrix sp.]|nr:DUF3105 domain-containing protein [Labilithrix sp.]MCW5813123.1 DUF3105 domain-containing protein [Labilithrix sp.]